MSSRKRSRSGKSNRWLILLICLGMVIVGLLLLAPMLVTSWVRSYIQKEAFRGKMEQFFGTKLQGSVTLAPLRWTGDEVTTQDAHAMTSSGWKAIVSSLHLALDWNAFRQGKWHIINAGADALDLNFTKPTPSTTSVAEQQENEVSSKPEAAATSTIPAWLRSYLPSTTEVDGMNIDRLSLQYPGPWRLTESKLRLGAWQQGELSVQASITGGVIETPIQLPVQPRPMKFNLIHAATRLSREDLHLSEATLHWLDDSVITLNGHLKPKDGSWNMNAQLAAIPLREVLSDDWKLRLTGMIEGSLEAQSSPKSTPVVKGQIQLKNGVLTALPILDKLATYTGVERFKRIILDIASADISGSAYARRFDKIIIQSNGLMRLEGSLSILNDQLDGRFMIGVTPETLRWIPGAQTHVFTATNPSGTPGLVWTPLRITGSIDAPREDLSERLIGGAGKALLTTPAEVVGKTGEMLLKPVLGEDLSKKPGEVLKSATDILTKPGESAKKASELPTQAVEKGLDLFKGVGSGLLGK
jgi:hypothetical protein